MKRTLILKTTEGLGKERERGAGGRGKKGCAAGTLVHLTMFVIHTEGEGEEGRGVEREGWREGARGGGVGAVVGFRSF